MTKNSILLFLLVMMYSNLCAQNDIRKNPFWLNFGVGGSDEYLNLNISFNKSLEDFAYQIALNGGNKNIIGTNGVTTGNIGFGLSHNKIWLISSIYTGPSVSYGHAVNSQYQKVYFWGFGFAVNAQAYFMPFYELFPDVGFGVELYYNHNALQTENVNYKNSYSIRAGICLTNIHIY